MQDLHLSHETSHEQIDRELAEQLRQLEAKRQTANARRDAALAIAHKPGQFASERAALQRRYDAVEAGRTFKERESLREQIHNVELMELGAKPAAEEAALEVRRIDAEISNLQVNLQEVERQAFNRRTVSLLADLVQPWTAAVQASEALDVHIASGRAHGYAMADIGIAIEWHPGASRASRRSDDVRTYLEFLLAQRDPKFAASLSEDHPARCKLRAAANGAGVAGLGLRWG